MTVTMCMGPHVIGWKNIKHFRPKAGQQVTNEMAYRIDVIMAFDICIVSKHRDSHTGGWVDDDDDRRY